MSEWLKEHAWKAKRVSGIERHRHIQTRNRFDDFRLHDARYVTP